MTPSPPRRPYRRTKVEQSALEAQVVRVCLQLFAEGGYEAISMRKLASEVGVAPMSLYRYFPTKAHLMRHIWEDILCRACESGVQEAHRVPQPLPRLRAFCNGFIQYWLENRSHYWVVFAIRDDLSELHADASSDVLRPDPQQVLDALQDLISECAGNGTTNIAHAPPTHPHLVEGLFHRLLGFLLGVIGLASVSWADVAEAKERLLDDVEQQVKLFFHASVPAQPAAQPAG